MQNASTPQLIHTPAQGRGGIELGIVRESVVWNGVVWRSVVWSGVVWSGALWVSQPALGQIEGDRTLGTLVNGSATAPCLAATCTLAGGTLNTTSDTLLHSLRQFSLQTPEQSAQIVDPGVNDIVIRVTGGEGSLINGTIQSSAGSQANLFLVNPSGIEFGPTARLDLGGAFVASTASQIEFDNGAVLLSGQAIAPTEALLTVSAPVGLGFLADEPSGSITVRGSGNLLTFGAPDTSAAFVNRTFQQGPLPPGSPLLSELAVQPETAITLIGNGITLTGGNLTAAGGQIELGSVSAGRVGLSVAPAVNDPSISYSTGDYSQVSTFADITLDERSTIDVSAPQPGRSLLRGQNISVLGSSAVLAERLPTASESATAAQTNGLIDVQAAGTTTVSGFTLDPSRPPFHSYLSVDVAPSASGAGGTLNIQTQNLRVDAGAQLGANTYGSGDGGRIQVTAAETLSLSGGSVLGPSGLFAIADEPGNSNAGQIAITAEHLLMEQGAQISTNSFSQGVSGSITVDATRVSLAGTSEPIEIAPFEIAPSQLAPTPDAPASEDIMFTFVTPTLLQSGMGQQSRGQGGSVAIIANQVNVTDGAEITTGTFGPGNAGNLKIDAKSVEVIGFSPIEGPSGIFTTVGFGAQGSGGDLNLETDQLRVLGGAQVATSTAGEGRAGDLTVRSESVQLSGRTPQGRSGLFATAIGGVGAGGNLTVESDQLTLDSGAALSVGNFPSAEGSPIPSGRGAAGNLQVEADQISLRNQSLLNADTVSGDRGNIRLQTDLLALRQGSRITTNATGTATGGNIDIESSGFILAVPSENSDITANAVFGDGGQVNITAQSILGIAEQPALTPQSDITASSEFGVAGQTRLVALDSEIRPEAQPLPQSAEIPAVAQGCVPETAEMSRFEQSGRSGISTSPYGVLNRRESLADVSLPNSLFSHDSLSSQSSRVAEAQSWGTNQQGQIVLMVENPNSSGERCTNWR